MCEPDGSCQQSQFLLLRPPVWLLDPTCCTWNMIQILRWYPFCTRKYWSKNTICSYVWPQVLLYCYLWLPVCTFCPTLYTLNLNLKIIRIIRNNWPRWYTFPIRFMFSDIAGLQLKHRLQLCVMSHLTPASSLSSCCYVRLPDSPWCACKIIQILYDKYL